MGDNRNATIPSDLDFPGFVRISDFTAAGGEASHNVSVNGDTDLEYIVFLLSPTTSANMIMRMNNDSGTVYGNQYLINSGGSISGSRYADSKMANTNGHEFATYHIQTPAGLIKSAVRVGSWWSTGTSMSGYSVWALSYNSTSNINALNFLMSTGNFPAGARVIVWARRAFA